MKREDKEFLKELQYEMLTQDTYSQANPRFWTVMQTVRDYGIDYNYDIDGQVLISNGEIIAETLEETFEVLLNLTKDKNLYNINFIEKNFIKINDINNFCNICIISSIEEAYKFIIKNLYTNVELVNYKNREEVVPNTMFLTLKECKNHIEVNNYHYNKPHPYAMTAWRSPQVSKLYDILLNTNWENI